MRTRTDNAEVGESPVIDGKNEETGMGSGADGKETPEKTGKRVAIEVRIE